VLGPISPKTEKKFGACFLGIGSDLVTLRGRHWGSGYWLTGGKERKLQADLGGKPAGLRGAKHGWNMRGRIMAEKFIPQKEGRRRVEMYSMRALMFPRPGQAGRRGGAPPEK